MNAERLQSIIDFLLKAEDTTKIQDKLNTLRANVANLVSAPAEATYQRQAVEALTELQKTVSSFVAGLSPAQKTNILDIRAQQFFSNEMVAEIAETFAKGGMTPAVVQQQVQKLFDERTKYLETLRSAQASLNTLGVDAEPLAAGEAEIGFLIPRTLFHDNLSDFQKELKTLNSIIRTFYEISNVTPEPIALRQLSTTDPLIVLGVAVKVLIALGKAIKWCSDTIKGTMELKKIVDAARAASVDQPVLDGLEQQIEKRIDKCVKEKVTELLDGYNGDAARKNELKGPLEKSLEQLLERVANGMTVEIRLLPPAKKPDSDGAEELTQQAQFDELKQIAQELEFPQIPPGQPMLQITREEPEDGQAAPIAAKGGRKPPMNPPRGEPKI
jgi:hypothetical protein